MRDEEDWSFGEDRFRHIFGDRYGSCWLFFFVEEYKVNYKRNNKQIFQHLLPFKKKKNSPGFIHTLAH